MSTHTTPKTASERNRDYRERLAASGKHVLRLVVDAQVASQMRAMSRTRVESQADIFVKALAALQEAEALAVDTSSTAADH